MHVLSGERLDTSIPPECVLGHEELWEDLKRLLEQCWSSEPSKRPKASSVRLLLKTMTKGLVIDQADQEVETEQQDYSLIMAGVESKEHDEKPKRRLTV